MPIVNANNAFISSLDHLPCDVVRSLWLIQSLALKNRQLQRKLDALTSPSARSSDPECAKKLLALLERNSREATEEARQIEKTLQTHRAVIENDLELMDKLCEFKDANKDPQRRWQEWDSYKRQFVKDHQSEIGDLPLELQEHRLKLRLSLKDNNNNKKRKKKKKKKKEGKMSRSASRSATASAKASSEPEEVYCFCHKPASGKMVGCDNPKCKEGGWFHYKCVGLKKDPDPKQKWFCSDECKRIYQRKGRH